MERIRKHIGLLLGMMIALSSCGREEVKVIPRSELAEIYAEMFVTDQWIMNTPGIRMIADTSLVYAPILEKYGYTTEDYLNTVDVYMDDPERFAKVLRTSGEILEARLKDLKEQKRLHDEALRKKNERERFMRLYGVTLDPGEYRTYLFDEPYVHYYDSLAFEADSLSRIYRLKSIERADTLYDCIRMLVPADSSAVADSAVVRKEELPENHEKTDLPEHPGKVKRFERLKESERTAVPELPEKIRR